MKANSKLEYLLQKLIERQGVTKAERTLNSIIQDSEDSVLTIIPNAGIHRIPNQYMRGTVFIGSQGNLDFSTQESVQTEYEKILLKLKETLLSRTWKKYT